MNQTITTEWIRLDAFLKLCGLSESGGQAKMAIIGGEVSVNDEVCLLRGKKLRDGDIVTYHGVTATVRQEGTV